MTDRNIMIFARVTEDERARFRALCAIERTTMQDVMARLVRAYLAEREGKAMQWIVKFNEPFNGFDQFTFTPTNAYQTPAASGLDCEETGEHEELPTSIKTWDDVAAYLEASYADGTILEEAP